MDTADREALQQRRRVPTGTLTTSHVITRSENGRRHEVDFGETAVTVSLHAVAETVELAIEADDPDRLSHMRRFALVNIPRHLFSKAMADLARQDREQSPSDLR